ncbi:hypothetical protein A7982_13042 [Minicystis rosea]|nr:hypothetical protein A7982_13042 [Minicystis rosea]
MSISFDTPDAQFPPSSLALPTLNLFLYEIQENRELRSTEPLLERQASGRVLSLPPPVRVDCRYLVTAWAKPGVPLPHQDEHRILGEALRVLLRHREIPSEALRGDLVTQALPLRTVVLQGGQQQSRVDIWQALGGKPRASFYYAVTVGVEVGEPEDVGAVASVVKA